MKANIKLSIILLGIALAFSFSSCERIKFDEDENAGVNRSRAILQEYETDGGDFAFLKSVIGRTNQEAIDYVTQNGYVENDANSLTIHYIDSGVDTISKILSLHFEREDFLNMQNAEMMVRCNNFDTLSAIFKQWFLEIRNSSSFPLLVREKYSMRTNAHQYLYFDTPEQLLDALESIDQPIDDVSVSFSANDSQAYEYSLTMRYDIYNYSTPAVYMQIINERVNTPLSEVPTVNLTEEYLGKDILIAKVDYMTFEYGGFCSTNVTNKQNEGNEIPFFGDYMSPSDGGYVKLYYRDESNLLMYGTIIWNGCGELIYPNAFVKGGNVDTYVPEYTMKRSLLFPSDRISYIDADGNYVQDVDESDNDLGYIWQTLSAQEEFMSYYEQTAKKVAVFLYAPSVGVGDPYEWYYMVFVER